MNMLSKVAPWDLVAEGYSKVTMKMFRSYADAALAQVDLHAGSHVLDVACGPGTLALSIAKDIKSVSAIDFSQPMIDILNTSIEEQNITNIESFCGDAQELPYADNSFDAAFSMFGLMFFPDRMKGYSEIQRTLKPGGKILVSSWAPTVQSTLMMAVFGSIRAMNPDVPEPESDIDSLENPDFFKAELEQAGFKEVQVLAISNTLEVTNIEEFWDDMVKGSAPIIMMKNSMPEAAWQEKNAIALQYLHDTLETLPTKLTANAWLGVGTK